MIGQLVTGQTKIQNHAVGSFQFEGGKPASLTVSTTGTVGYVIVDAVRLVELDNEGQPLVLAALPESETVQQAESQVEQLKGDLASLDQQIKQLEKDAPPPLPKAIAVDLHRDSVG